MKILVNRSRFLWSGFLLLGFFILLNRFLFLIGTEEVTGKAIFVLYNGQHYRLVEFSVKNQPYYIEWDSDHGVKYKDELPIRYKTGNPDDARIFTFWGFWMVPVFYSLAVVIVFVPITIVFFENHRTFLLDFSKLKRKSDEKSKDFDRRDSEERGIFKN
ncbi:MAG: hypothetical protein K1X82_09480 [Bacteroidia bacterium]|nr:hypothetical protein [Bacteroidia bacterium]